MSDNLLVVKFPEVAKQWDHNRNDENLSRITASSGKKVWWLCYDKGVEHSWTAKIYSRTKMGRGCPVCSNQLIIPGINSLEDTNPDICNEWDHEKNDKSPSEVSKGSKYKAHWVCEKNPEHTWIASVNNRVNKGSQCPKCSRPGGKLHDRLFDEFAHDLNPEINPKELSINSHIPVWWRCTQDSAHTWKVSPNQRTSHGTGCPKCSSSVSKLERDLADYISRTEKTILNSREIIPPYELDIFVPDKGIAFEFNGVLWHSDKYQKDKNYHKNKMDECNKRGIRLIMVWEDDWIRRPQIVKRMIDRKLGVSVEDTIYARNTYIDGDVPLTEIRDFQNSNHIQGYGAGGIKIGLREKNTGDLVATMTLKKRASSALELVRYCTSKMVVGGHSKLISWVEGNIQYKHIYTFADLSVSDGDLYEKTGWTRDMSIPPDYTYLYLGERHHKFNFRKKSFKSNPKFLYEDGMTERELADLNSLYRIYDCGKIRYIKPNPNLI